MKKNKIYVYQSQGERENQEDSYVISQKKRHLLIAVADGMGGFEKGELASKIAVQKLEERFLQEGSVKLYRSNFFSSSFQDTCLQLLQEARKEKGFINIGTTVAAAVIVKGRKGYQMFYSWMGDTRIYLYSREKTSIEKMISLPEGKENGHLWLLTKDHTTGWELFRRGELSLEELSSHPTRGELMAGLHPFNMVMESTYKVPLFKGDRVLICSDGAWEAPGFHDFIAEALENNSLEKAYKKIAKFLQRNEKKGLVTDNNTFILVEVSEELFE